MILVAVSALMAFVAVLVTFKVWRLSAAEVSSKFNRQRYGRVMRGLSVASLSAAIFFVVQTGLFAAVAFGSQREAMVIGIGYIAAGGLLLGTGIWGRPSALLLPAVRRRPVWVRVVVGRDSQGAG
jgi:hypothetical protein